jgi:hypothetical protein
MKKVKCSVGFKIKEEGFKAALYALSPADQEEARAEICRLCFWTDSLLKAKWTGKRPFKMFEIQQIENFFAARNINAWTGEPLNK